MKQIMESLLHCMQEGKNTVLVTIVAQIGSTPRGCGAQMLVDESGRLCGTVGGGAIEGKAIETARKLLVEKRSARECFSLDGSTGRDTGMVCGGGVELMFCFADSADPRWTQAAEEVIHSLTDNLPGYLTLCVDTPPVLNHGHSDVPFGGACCGEEYILPLPIQQRVILCGGGHVAQALVPVLASVDFRVTVLENRPEFADPRLFPAAEQVILGDYSKLSQSIDCQADDFFVIMTHGHTHDFILQEQLLRGEYAYIGVMGSRRKIASVNARLLEAGIPAEAMERVHTPIGLKIGAVTPAEIAVSVAAECIAVRAALRGSSKSSCPSSI